jgi:phenylalanyl-tRNA synthetase beta chain
VPDVAALAAGLIALVAGGAVAETIDVGPKPKPRRAVTLQPARVGRLLGDRVTAAETAKLLKSVGFGVLKAGTALRVSPPTWRHDVSRDVDLVEEVARLRGYDRLPDDLTGARPGNVPDHPLYTMGQRVRDALVAHGLLETRPLPYMAGAADAPLVRVQNPIGEDEPFLRARLLDTLARRAEYNLSRMQGDVRLFEIGTSFGLATDGGVREEIRVGALVMGARRPRHFTEPEPPAFDAWDAKALAEVIAQAAWPGARAELATGDGDTLWALTVDGTPRGSVRAVALDAPVWANAAFGVEVTLGRMPAAPVAARGAHDYSKGDAGVARRPVRYVPLPTTPSAEFDLALVVPDAVPAARVEEIMRRAAGDTLEAMVIFDEYRGEHVPPGTRSVAWRLTFRHPERTLRDKEIEGRRAQLLKTLETEVGARVRTS